ncbi:hypothetical protein [Phormidesmis priestleyi]
MEEQQAAMPLFAILHADYEGLHSSSCTIIAATSVLAIAQDILNNPDRWQAVLRYVYPDDEDSGSLWQRLQGDALTPQDLLTLINKTSLDVGFGEMLRIQLIEIACLDDLIINSRWSIQESGASNSAKADLGASQGNLLDSLRFQLVEDARSLLTTQGFQKYVQTLLSQDIWQYSNLAALNLITPDLSTWLLTSLGIPVKLSNSEIRENSPDRGELKNDYHYFHTIVRTNFRDGNRQES